MINNKKFKLNSLNDLIYVSNLKKTKIAIMVKLNNSSRQAQFNDDTKIFVNQSKVLFSHYKSDKFQSIDPNNPAIQKYLNHIYS